MPLLRTCIYLKQDFISKNPNTVLLQKKSVKKLLLKANQPIPKFLQILLAEYLRKYLM